MVWVWYGYDIGRVRCEMATVPQVRPKKRSDEELAAELGRVLESYFDDIGLTQAERDARYAAVDKSLDARDAARARS
jgi:hypothetical protein